MKFRIQTGIKVFSPEFLFVTYFWGFILLRPLLQAVGSKSTLILSIYVVLLLSLFIINMVLKRDIKIGESVFLMLFIFCVFFIDAVLRNNPFSFEYLYKYIYCGLLPVIFLSKIRDTKKVLLYFTWFSLFVFLLFGSDPIDGFGLFGDYMDYGFNFALPAFLGLFIGCFYFKRKWMSIFVVLCFFSILIYANRSSFLTILIFMLLYFILISSNRIKIILKWILPFTLVFLLVIFNLKSISYYIYNIVILKLDINSYAINKIISYIETRNDSVLFSGRTEIWAKANNMIKENLLFGHGMGAFQHQYGYYSHNIYLDLLLFFGIIGLVFFGIFIIYSIYKILKSSESTRILGFLFFSLWFPKLFFSTFFIEDIGFWCFFSIPFIIKYFNKENF